MKGRLEDWQEVTLWNGKVHISGDCFDSEAFPKGERMVTSSLVQYHTLFGKLCVETASGSMYELGEPTKEELTFADIVRRCMAN